ncbi:hypothetical protein [Sphingobacterium faecium]|uniref:hypothetical protein n=1 Tax=Sphingobacterium faecium TaxID=34087 RepID=UPI0024683651|nr:hypothetical protein [Sphingobacterium faecium]MDH5825797.1 hypothetical protein [Sphingobacterium faecium]
MENTKNISQADYEKDLIQLNPIEDSLKKIWDKKHHEDELTESAKKRKELEAENELKDHYAGLAMQGILSSQNYFRGNGVYTSDEEAIELSIESYVIAEAMIKRRKELMNG